MRQVLLSELQTLPGHIQTHSTLLKVKAIVRCCLNNIQFLMNKTLALLLNPTKTKLEPSKQKNRGSVMWKLNVTGVIGKKKQKEIYKCNLRNTPALSSNRNAMKIWVLMDWWARRTPVFFKFLSLPCKGPKECIYQLNVSFSDLNEISQNLLLKSNW